MNKTPMLAAAALAAVLFAAASAQAATFTYTATSGDDPFTASGSLNLGLDAGQPGAFYVTGIDAVVDAGLLTQDVSTALVPTSAPGAVTYLPDGLFYYDNLLYKNAPFVDVPGIEFKGASGTLYNLFSNGTNYTLYEDVGGAFGPVSTGALSVSDVPEPAVWAMMLTGFFGLGAVLRARRKSAAIA